MKDQWNERYSSPDFAYGEEPNRYLEQRLKELPPGKILFPAEGEGRNAVFAIRQGWIVSAFDQAEEGKKKAMVLAEKNDVVIDYQVGQLSELNYLPEQFDAIALIYAHFPADIKSGYHKLLSTFLRKGGVIIFEAFSKAHLGYVTANPGVGGPKDINMLFSIEEIQADFDDYEMIELEEVEVELNEGIYHNGKGSVIRFVGRKK